MSAVPPAVQSAPLDYPDSDGKPMADNTKQARWMATLKGNFDALFAHRPDVFVAMDLLWYPIEGEPDIRVAPDVMVVLGRPRGDRGSYRQWAEGGVPVTVAFEILSPGNDPREMADKYTFYTEHGVEEYYIYDPDDNHLTVYVRQGTALRRIRPADGFQSPALGIRFDLTTAEEMIVYSPKGRPFLTFEELAALQERTERRADDEKHRADDEKRRADQAHRRLARVVELGRKARLGQATSEELAELEKLESEASP